MTQNDPKLMFDKIYGPISRLKTCTYEYSLIVHSNFFIIAQKFFVVENHGGGKFIVVGQWNLKKILPLTRK